MATAYLTIPAKVTRLSRVNSVVNAFTTGTSAFIGNGDRSTKANHEEAFLQFDITDYLGTITSGLITSAIYLDFAIPYSKESFYLPQKGINVKLYYQSKLAFTSSAPGWYHDPATYNRSTSAAKWDDFGYTGWNTTATSALEGTLTFLGSDPRAQHYRITMTSSAQSAVQAWFNPTSSVPEPWLRGLILADLNSVTANYPEVQGVRIQDPYITIPYTTGAAPLPDTLEYDLLSGADNTIVFTSGSTVEVFETTDLNYTLSLACPLNLDVKTSTLSIITTITLDFTVDFRTGFSPFDVTFYPSLSIDSNILQFYTITELRWYFDYSRNPGTYQVQSINAKSLDSVSVTKEFKGYRGKTFDVACIAILSKD